MRESNINKQVLLFIYPLR